MTAMMDAHLAGFTEQNRAALRRLAAHGHQNIDLSSRPPKSLAAVLVLLFQEAGQLRVLLTTRAKHLRTHAGQTAFPGGKKDEEDRDLIYTALREAHEEVALPMDSPHIHILCTLEPFVSMHKLVVTPVVAFLTDNSVITALRPSQGEVSHIFSHPLEAILDPLLSKAEPLVPFGSEDWLYPDEFHNTNDIILSPLGNTPYRMHRFRSLGSPIKGLTSEVLIMTAEIAFASKATYEHFAPGQPVDFKTVLARIVEEETKGTNSQFVS